ncbi:MAG: DUF5677 domain-containing protein [Acidobacteria bacterium]|nr:DUF5677 domain-containing protein [Acidobacteriota bacterium]
MRPVDEGFLSEEAAAVQRDIRAKYPAWSGLLRRLNIFAHRVIPRLTVQSRNGQQVLAACILLKLLGDVQGAVLLAERGMESQARSLLRVAVEALFVLVNLCKNEEFLRTFIYKAEIERLKLIEAILKNPARVFDEVRPHLTPELIERLTKEIEEAAVTPEKVKELAGRGKLSHFYDGPYRLLCQDVHTSARSLERYALTDKENDLIGLRYGPITDDFNFIHSTAAQVLIGALGVVDSLLGLSLEPELRPLDQEVVALLQRDADEAEG